MPWHRSGRLKKKTQTDFQPDPPPLFSFPREIRNRIYFWLIAGNTISKRHYGLGSADRSDEPEAHKRLALRDRISFNPRGPAAKHAVREKLAAKALQGRDVQALLATSRVVTQEFVEELAVYCARLPAATAAAATARCNELNIFGVGAPGTDHLNLFNMLLVELFISTFMPDVSLVVVHCMEGANGGLFQTVVDHFKGNGATRVVLRDEIWSKTPGMLKMRILGSRWTETNWIGESVMLSGTLNDFLRPQMKLSR